MTPSLPEKIVAIHDCLSQGKIDHAFGGALALAFYGEPRTTIDIDLNVFIPPSGYGVLRNLLGPLGISDEVDIDVLEREGQCRLWWDDTPIDLFFAYDKFHDAMEEDRRLVPFADSKLPILAPEHLVICKAIFDRRKDWLDIEQILVCVESFDVEEVHRWLVRILDKSDLRLQRFNNIVEELPVKESN